MLFSSGNYTLINQKAKDSVVLLPLGATEQHGPHLAVSTDTDIVSQIALQTEKQLPDDVLLCPALPFGSSHHHLSFGGTISISSELYTMLITEIVKSLLRQGFKKIVLLNGHGGNIVPIKQSLAILSSEFDAALQPNIALATYWELAGKIFAGTPPLQSPALSHACEYETSLMLHLFPEKVWFDKVERAKRPISNWYIPWEEDEPYKGVTVVKQTEFISSNGSSGEPHLASKEKGMHLFDHAVKSVVEFIESFKDWPLLESLKDVNIGKNRN